MVIEVKDKPTFRISVRDLVELNERSGDINFRFSTRSTALEGIRGHQRLQKSRGDNYEAEKKVSKSLELPDFNLELSGRVDGYYPDVDFFIVEEIKTVRVDVALIPDSVKKLHWGQAKVYAYLLAELHGAESITVRLCYLDLDQDQEFQLEEKSTFTALAEFFSNLIERHIHYLRRLMVWQQTRNESIEKLQFPYDGYRPGQREMAVSVYRALRQENQLIMQAPTGIGKTIASIFPAVKAINELGYDKLFYLSAKTSGQLMAQKAIADLRESGLNLRDVTLTAKDKICFNPGSPCDPEHCQFARGYYDKLPDIVNEVLEQKTSLDRNRIEEIAARNEMCPFELSLDLSLISDVVICDYNYVFDPAVYLRRYFESKGGDNKSRYAVLMDESHNLVDRGRDMFSAEFCKDDVLALRRLVKSDLPLLAKRLGKINAEMLAVLKPVKQNLKLQGSIQLEQCPEKVMKAIKAFTDSAEQWLQLNQTSYFQADLLSLYFDALRMQRTIESADKGYAFLMLEKQGKVFFKAFCLNPGPRLAEGFDRVKSSVCFSATMSPQPYFNSLMGIRDSADWYQIESPFAAENFGVFTTGYIATTYKNRGQSLYELVDTIHSVIEAKPGNYLVFFPSHAYLSEVSDKFSERHGGIKTMTQSPRMDDSERQAFLDAFDSTTGTLLGFAVMGGIFGEGIDLKGARLIGAIIVGVGLPQIGLERNLIRDYFNKPISEGADNSDLLIARQGQGFEFAYQYPGMNRVLQTAGRVIRSETDRGIVCLIDHRFNEARYRNLFPANWQPKLARNRLQLTQYLRTFWQV